MSELVFDSLLDVPLGEPTVDHDDSLVPSSGSYDPVLVPEPFMAPSLITIAVPFRGPLTKTSRGKAVIAMKRALARCPAPNGANYLAWEGKSFTGVMGDRASKALRRFRRNNNLSDNVVYDLAAHKLLARYYDAYAIALLVPEDPKPSPDELKRAAFLGELMYLYNRRYAVMYTQRRPFDLRKPPSGLDCSASGEWAAKWAGLPSLSGYSSFGYGNTWTQLERFRAKGWVHDSISESKIGDPRYYGRSSSNPTHVAFFIGREGGRSRVWSNGSYPIKILDATYRHDRIADCNLTGV